MDNFKIELMMKRLTDPTTYLTEEELEAYCRYSQLIPAKIGVGLMYTLDNLDTLLSTRILFKNLPGTIRLLSFYEQVVNKKYNG